MAQAQLDTIATNPSLIWPISGTVNPDTNDISSAFGPRWQASQNRYDYHPGIDIAQPIGTPVHVITDGVVSRVGWLSSSSGLTIIVYHPTLDLYSAYLHLNSAAVVENQAVTQGEIIGEVGDSGTTTFAHLHFEIRLTADNYPASTRNPLGYLPRPEVTTPTIQVSELTADPIYSPTVTLFITATRAELDVNQIRVALQDWVTGIVLDEQLVDFNERIHTGDDTLNQDGIQLIPAHFNTSTQAYELTANFYQLHGYDSFTLTAQVVDLAGNVNTAVLTATDMTPPATVTDLTARKQANGDILLQWTAPGDSGYVGQAASYDIRYASEPLNNFTWQTAIPISSPVPIPGGQQQTWLVSGPLPEPVYFALRATDPEGQQSLLSNSAQAQWMTFLPLIMGQ